MGKLLNCLESVNAPFKDFQVITIGATVNDIRQLYTVLNALSIHGVSDCEYKYGYVHVRGNIEATFEALRKSGITVVKPPEPMMILSPTKANDMIIMMAIFYKALERSAFRKGFRCDFRKKWKRLLPNRPLPELIQKDLAYQISTDLAVVHGLYTMLEILADGRALLWVDLYNPITKFKENVIEKRLSFKEIQQLDISDREHVMKRLPNPFQRKEKIQLLLSLLCEGGKLSIEFADGHTVDFKCNFMPLEVLRSV